MNRYLLILIVLLCVTQLEIAALALVDSMNLRVWNSQAQLNDQLVNAFTDECSL